MSNLSLASLIPPLFVLLWATGFIGARYAMPYAEPFTFLALRFALTIALLLPVMMWPKRRLRRRHVAHAVFAGMLIHGVYLGGVFWAIHRGMPAGLSALIIGLQPLVTSIIAGSALGERILPRHWIGLGVGFVGVVLVLAPKLGTLGGEVTPATLCACLISVVAISAGTVWQKRHLGRADLIGGTLWQYAGAGLLMTAASLVFETRDVTPSGELFFALAWLVLVLSIGAIFLLMYLIREGEMARVSSLFYLVPACTALMAWVLFDETLNALQIVGMAITTVGVGLATQPGTRARASR